jgi:o-succinylbenzoate synthase
VYSLSYRKHIAHFTEPGGTSRGILYQKPSWIIQLSHSDYSEPGYGEISIIPKLSIETEEGIEDFLNQHSTLSDNQLSDLLQTATPAIRFGFEMAVKSLESQALEMFGEEKNLNLKTNGLVWMGSIDDMWHRAQEKYSEGFRCLKFKIGALNFEDELALLKKVRSTWGNQITLRLDANGAFTPINALHKLERLSELNIHSIEQPIKAGQSDEMAKLCQDSPIDIALDEELIGIKSLEEKKAILEAIQPQYIILKNSLVGGWKEAAEWIALSENKDIGWWATSALELNIGLNAIAYQLADYTNDLPQGLGTGKVFSNNIKSNLMLDGEHLKLKSNKSDLLLANTKKMWL